MKELLKLDTPIEINGKKVEELAYDTEEITSEMFIHAASMANEKSRKMGCQYITIIESDYNVHLYLGMMAVIAVDTSIDILDLERLKGKDVIKLAQVGRNFITAPSAENSQQSSSDEQ